MVCRSRRFSRNCLRKTEIGQSATAPVADQLKSKRIELSSLRLLAKDATKPSMTSASIQP